MGRSKKIYNYEKSMKRGYSEWVPDSFDSPEGRRFVARIIKKVYIKIDKHTVMFKRLDIKQ